MLAGAVVAFKMQAQLSVRAGQAVAVLAVSVMA
jgi:hypothetical protein